MTPATTGYSGTPLGKKLGIKAGSRVCLLREPEGYQKLLAPLPDGVQFVAKISASVDIMQVFTASKSELAKILATCRKLLKPDAAIWVSWPKKASKVPTDITEDTIRAVALPMGLVDIKVCAVDKIWSGLKLVLRKELRG
jgi:bifunctional DNA-binding transcriptional regulator/antitoxin component of YhaV-PrlF toxin-antitoxin module